MMKVLEKKIGNSKPKKKMKTQKPENSENESEQKIRL